MLTSLPLGAHLTTPRRGYTHHGIYVGDGRVIHYAGFSRLFRRGPIEEVSLEQFTRGRDLAVKGWVAPKFSGTAIVVRARSRLGENRHRLWSNNCEHFSEWCISGTSRSPQVAAWKARINNGLAKLGLSTGSGAFHPKSAPTDWKSPSNLPAAQYAS